MATIRKRNDKWQVLIRRKGHPTISRNFHRRSDADEWARFTECQVDRGELPSSPKALSKIKVRDIIERYRNEVSVKKRSYNTEKFILEAIMRLPLADLSLAHVSAANFCSYRDQRLKLVKPGTVNRELGIVKHAFDIAMREWDIPLRENPLAKIKKLKAQNARNRRLSPEEFEILKEEVTRSRNPHIIGLIQFAIETAMRRGEILRLRWNEIDFKAKTLFIPLTKNGYSRKIPLSSQAIKLLKELENNRIPSIIPFTLISKLP